MKNDSTIALLEDMAKLLKKHGPDTFHALANGLDSAEFVPELIKILRKFAEEGRITRSKKAKKQIPVLETKEQAFDPEKNVAIEALRKALMDANVVRHVRDLRNLAAQLHIPIKGIKGAQTRWRIVDVMISGLSNRPIDELNRFRLQLNTEKGGNELSSWSSIILPKTKHEKQNTSGEEDDKY